MHAKCLMKILNLENITVCYNSLLSGYALKSRVKDVVVLFCEMRGLGVEINGVTMLGLVQPCGIPGNLGLGMCVHGFCVKFGLDMDSSVGNCLLTMYVKSGENDCGRKLFNEMPRKGLITWNAMINGYAQNGLANNVLELYKEMESKGVCPDPLTLVGVLSSCAHLGALSAGNLEGILRVRMLMRERKLKKDPGCSYVEFKGRIHLFFAGDRNHPQINEIYKKLNELENLVKDLDGCKKNDHERREEYLNSMGVHSEKLAVAFALLNTRKETEIIIIKNLRICGDCHLFIKMVSKIVDRQFVVRDATRFHHFKNGFCSCKEYW
ncbi:hypothetical protein OIU77_031030 [Salix suchowensis]|uniref:DYW domain-containing protein n=1 Tax=Salix suchowensis TaxID=1278906 RepID=A0ABQ9BFR2_9ROSI|nr:hypothetical protein OIU77_031030 [Salix suchowensis]